MHMYYVILYRQETPTVTVPLSNGKNLAVGVVGRAQRAQSSQPPGTQKDITRPLTVVSVRLHLSPLMPATVDENDDADRTMNSASIRYMKSMNAFIAALGSMLPCVWTSTDATPMSAKNTSNFPTASAVQFRSMAVLTGNNGTRTKRSGYF